MIIFNKILDGQPIKEIKNEDEREAINRFNDYTLSKVFGYTPNQIAEMPESYYNDYLLLENLTAAKEKAKIEAMKNKRK